MMISDFRMFRIELEEAILAQKYDGMYGCNFCFVCVERVTTYLTRLWLIAGIHM